MTRSLLKFQLVLYVVSFAILALAQPDWSIAASVCAACLGYALFWRALLLTPKRRTRFLLALLWFAALQLIQLNWLMTDRYVGGYIYLFVSLLALGMGVQFALVSLLIPPVKRLGVIHMVGISGAWVIMEWSRLFFLSGYTWNPSGLALTSTLWGTQLISVIGIFGLGFWIFFTNLLALKCFMTPSWSRALVWGVVALVPYLSGWAHIQYHSSKEAEGHVDALLVQTALYPEYKVSIDGSQPLSPYYQWERVFMMVVPHLDKPLDLIVLPEGAIPYGTDWEIYEPERVHELFTAYFGGKISFPEVTSQRVGNSYWAQTLANILQADLVIGLDDVTHNAAFHFSPLSNERERYEKRVLLPMGEYIPFEWCKKILSRYGIVDSYTPGKEAKIFHMQTVDAGISICYEETFGHLMRENRQKGAQLLINVTNDVWYPQTRLPLVHALHGRLRSAETGVPALRVCNTGVTCAIDSFGRITDKLPYETRGGYSSAEALYLSTPIRTFPTLYTVWGDWPILSISLLSLVLLQLADFRRRKLSISELEVSDLQKN